MAGGTGLVGGHLLRLLLEDPAVGRVVSLGRRRAPLEHPKLEQNVVEFYRLPPQKGDDAYCCLGTTIKKAGGREAFRDVDFDAVLHFAKSAKAGGVKRFFLVSSLGADARSKVFYSRVKGEIESAVSALPFESVFIFRPSLLLGERDEFRLKEKIAEAAMAAVKYALVGGLRKYRAIEAADVALAMTRQSGATEKGVRVLESDEIQALANL